MAGVAKHAVSEAVKRWEHSEHGLGTRSASVLGVPFPPGEFTEQPQLRVFEDGLNRPSHASPPWRPLEQARRTKQKREAPSHEAVEYHGPRRGNGEHGF